MSAQNFGNRHPLLFYQRTMGRIGWLTLILGIVLAVVWWWRLVEIKTIYIFSPETLILLGAVVSIALSLFAFVARKMAYVRAHDKYLYLATPFLRLKISYRRIRSARPMLIQQIFPEEKSKWSQRKFLEPFYGKTALVVEMKSFPVNRKMLKMFLPAQIFSPQFTGLVILVPDWMRLSTELDSYRGSWQQEEKSRERYESIRSW